MSKHAARLVEKPVAAAYLSLSESGFDDWVRKGLIPGPWNGTKRWDLRAIDAALDTGSGLKAESQPKEQNDNEFDDWMKGA